MSIAKDLAVENPVSQLNDPNAVDNTIADANTSVVNPDPAPEPIVEDEVIIDPDVAVEPPAFAPNFKYTSLDQEYEFDEFLRPVITDEASQKRVKELYEKAAGIDHIKGKLTQEKEKNSQYETVQKDFGQLQQTFNYYDGLLEKKDYHAFFKVAGIPKEDILKHALDLVKYNDLPPEEKVAYDNNVALKQQNYNTELQNQQLQSQIANNSVQARTQMLDTALGGDQYNEAAQSFDTRMGRPGAFREAVINQGIMVENQTRNNPQGMTSLTPEEAATQVLQMAGIQVGGGQGGIPQNPATPQQVPTVAAQKPVIPNVQAGHRSPAKRVVKSIAELREIAKTMET